MKRRAKRSTDGAFMFGEKKGRRKKKDKSDPEAIWKWPRHTRAAFMLPIPQGRVTEGTVDIVLLSLRRKQATDSEY